MKIEETLFCVFDTETTGLDPEKDRIVEFGFCTCDLDGLGGRASCLFDPEMSIPASASAVHHIIDGDVYGLIPFTEMNIPKFNCYAAHNAAFDLPFTKITKPTICTMRLAQKLWPDLESYGNQFLRYHLKLNPPVERGAAMHRALPDAIVTATLLIHELKEVLDFVDMGCWSLCVTRLLSS